MTLIGNYRINRDWAAFRLTLSKFMWSSEILYCDIKKKKRKKKKKRQKNRIRRCCKIYSSHKFLCHAVIFLWDLTSGRLFSHPEFLYTLICVLLSQHNLRDTETITACDTFDPSSIRVFYHLIYVVTNRWRTIYRPSFLHFTAD